MAKNGKNTIEIRVIIFPASDCDVWIAQGLDYDICAQAPTIDTVHLAFQTALMATLKLDKEQGKEPLAGIEKAPEQFFKMYERSMVKTKFVRRAVPEEKRAASRTGWFAPIYKVTEALAGAVALA